MNNIPADLPPLVFAGGPPRSGTTILAKLLNEHPNVCTVINNDVFEADALFSYTTGEGLIRAIRRNEVSGEDEARAFLRERMVDTDAQGRSVCIDIAPSTSVEAFEARDTKPPTVAVPLEFLTANGVQLCLKSPMILGELDRLTQCFPDAPIVLSFRHPLKTAESMYHIAETRWHTSYHRDWERREKEVENYRPPIQEELIEHWAQATGFQKCLIYTVSLLRNLVRWYTAAPRPRVFVYEHADLLATPDRVLAAVASHLRLGTAGFQGAGDQLRATERPVADELQAQFDALAGPVGANAVYDEVRAICSTR